MKYANSHLLVSHVRYSDKVNILQVHILLYIIFPQLGVAHNVESFWYQVLVSYSTSVNPARLASSIGRKGNHKVPILRVLGVAQDATVLIVRLSRHLIRGIVDISVSMS